MNIAVIILGLVLLGVGIGLGVYFSYSYDEKNTKTINSAESKAVAKKRKAATTLLIIFGVALFVFGLSFKIVPTGYTGVRTTFGQISEQTVQKGFNFKIPIVQNIKLVNNKQQDSVLKTEVWGETSEKTPVYASNIIVTYQINPEKSAWIYANVNDPDTLIDQTLVSSAIKSAMVELSVNDVTNRSIIENLVREKLELSLNEKYGENTVNIVKITINNMDFEDSYNEAIAAKSIAQQNYEKQAIENNTAIEKAEADKKVAITNAEAQAEAKRISAQAESEANKMLVESLNDQVLRSKFYDKWDGKLPSVMGENAVITDVGQGNSSNTEQGS